MQLADLKGVGSGETVIFCGNGTTLNDFDLAKINPAHSIAASNFFLPFGPAKWGVEPNFYFCHDPSVLFASWERHRRFKHLPVPSDYDYKVATVSPAHWLSLERAWQRMSVILPRSLGWWPGYGVKAVLAGEDPAEAEAWLQEVAPHVYGYDPVVPKWGAWKARLRRRLRGQTYKRLDFDPRGWRWRPGLLDRLLAPIGPGFVHELDKSRVPLWAVNSFCSVILPILLWMGWQRIVLVGVDYSKEGYFFCPYRSGTGQQWFYREETEDFYFICDMAKRLPHKPIIQVVKASINVLSPPGGLVDFSEITR